MSCLDNQIKKKKIHQTFDSRADCRKLEYLEFPNILSWISSPAVTATTVYCLLMCVSFWSDRIAYVQLVYSSQSPHLIPTLEVRSVRQRGYRTGPRSHGW